MKIRCIDEDDHCKGLLRWGGVYEATPTILCGEPAYTIKAGDLGLNGTTHNLDATFFAWRFEEVAQVT